MRLRRVAAVLLIVALLGGLGGAALAASPPLELEAAVLGEAKVGGTITLELRCADNPGLYSAQLTLSYNTSVLKCVDCDAGIALEGMMTACNPKAVDGARIAAGSAQPATETGVLASFEFEVLAAGICNFVLQNTEFYLADKTRVEAKLSGTTSVAVPDAEGNVPPAGDQTGGDATGGVTEVPSFTDAAGHWAEEFLLAAAERGIMDGFPDGTCRPASNVTRAQFVTLLWRSMGQPAPKGKSSFVDLDPRQDWYHDALAWAEEKGYVEGVGAGKFLPENPVSRQEVATIIWRACGGVSGGELMFAGIYDKHFTDSDKVADWAKNAVYWAIYNEIWCDPDGLTVGTQLQAKQSASRAEIVVMMIRYQDNYGG